MVDKLFKAALSKPELVSNVSFQQLTKSNLLLGMQVLAKSGIEPPLFYSQLLSGVLKDHFKYNPRVLALKDFDSGSVVGSIKNVVFNYFKIKTVKVEPFGLEDSLSMIKTLSSLRRHQKYQESASDLLEYFSDLIIREEWDLSTDQAVEVLESTWDIEGFPAVSTLSQISKATLLPDLKTIKEKLEFYKRKDEFFDLLQPNP